MFGMLKSLTKAVVGVATLPIDLAADVITMGGAMTDRDQPYTMDKAGQIMRNLENAVDPSKD